MRDQISHYLDRARMAAPCGTLGRVTPLDATVEPLVRALERINRDKGVEHRGQHSDRREVPGREAGSGRNARQPARQRLQVEPLESLSHGRAGRCRRARAAASACAFASKTTDRASLAEQRAKIGKRGMRLDETKPGSGLGLSIVGDLVTSYRGGMRLDQSPHGGLLVELNLPAA